MHLKKSFSGGKSGAARISGAAHAVLGTDAKGQSSMYDTRSGTLLTMVLLFVIGWIPTIGVMISGYVGGRRAGSPLRGFAASVLGSAVVVGILLGITAGVNAVDSALVSAPESRIAEWAASSPMLEKMFNGILSYARAVFGNPDLTIDYGKYVLVIPFGIIGGILANQAQKEARLTVDSAARAGERSFRSLNLQREGRKIGFESYDQYVQMGVNTMDVPAPLREEKRVKAPVKKEVPSVTTVNVPARETTATATVSVPAERKEQPEPDDSTTYI